MSNPPTTSQAGEFLCPILIRSFVGRVVYGTTWKCTVFIWFSFRIETGLLLLFFCHCCCLDLRPRHHHYEPDIQSVIFLSGTADSEQRNCLCCLRIMGRTTMVVERKSSNWDHWKKWKWIVKKQEQSVDFCKERFSDHSRNTWLSQTSSADTYIRHVIIDNG